MGARRVLSPGHLRMARSFDPRRNTDEQRETRLARVDDAVLDARRRKHQRARQRFALLISDTESTTPFEHEVELIRSLVSVCALRLSRLKAVEADHDVLALPERSLVELLRLRARVLTPVNKMGHRNGLPHANLRFLKFEISNLRSCLQLP